MNRHTCVYRNFVDRLRIDRYGQPALKLCVPTENAICDIRVNAAVGTGARLISFKALFVTSLPDGVTIR